MTDLTTIAETLKPVISALWQATLFGLSSSKAAYFVSGAGLGLFLHIDWRKLTAGDWIKALLACTGLFVVVALITSVVAGGA